jgi:hypothetical protein
VEVLERGDRGVEGPLAADSIVDLRRRAIEGYLHVDVVGRGQPPGPLRGDPDAVGGELHPHVVRYGVLDQLPEVRPDRRFSTTDVDVEDLHPLELIDDRLALLGAQLARVASSRRRQAVRAREIAGVGQFPGQADRGVEPELELLDQ